MKTLLTLLLILCYNFSMGQDIAITLKGDTVILKGDFTWEYKVTQKDTVGLQETTTKINPVKPNADCKISESSIDEFSGVKTTVIKGNTKVTPYTCDLKMVSFSKGTSTNYVFYANLLKDLGCISYDSKLTILFTDGTTIEIKYMGDTDCGDNFYFYGLIDSYLDVLSTKEVKKMRFTGKTYADVEITNSKYFIETLSCLMQ